MHVNQGDYWVWMVAISLAALVVSVIQLFMGL